MRLKFQGFFLFFPVHLAQAVNDKALPFEDFNDRGEVGDLQTQKHDEPYKNTSRKIEERVLTFLPSCVVIIVFTVFSLLFFLLSSS